jgi:hypothetical protein
MRFEELHLEEYNTKWVAWKYSKVILENGIENNV